MCSWNIANSSIDMHSGTSHVPATHCTAHIGVARTFAARVHSILASNLDDFFSRQCTGYTKPVQNTR